MTRIIALANQKGGPGKTTCAINIACGWARKAGPGKVLLIDMDPQGNATTTLLGREMTLYDRPPEFMTLYNVLMRQAQADQAIYEAELVEAPGYSSATTLHVMPASTDMTSLNRQLLQEFQSEQILPRALAGVVSAYEAVIIDCPPSLEILFINAMMLAEEVLIPFDTGKYALDGMDVFSENVQMIRQANMRLHVAGVIPNKVDRTALSRDVREIAEQMFPGKLLPEIPARVAVSEANAVGLDIYAHDPKGDATKAFWALTEEVMKHG